LKDAKIEERCSDYIMFSYAENNDIVPKELKRLEPGGHISDRFVNCAIHRIRNLARTQRVLLMDAAFPQTLFREHVSHENKFKLDNFEHPLSEQVKDGSRLFDRYNFLAFPLNDPGEPGHWTSVVVHIHDVVIDSFITKRNADARRDIVYPGPVYDGTTKFGAIFILDSLGMGSLTKISIEIAREIRILLNFEIRAVLEKPVDFFDDDTLPLLSVDVPRQPNGCDCGMYSILFIETLVHNLDKLSFRSVDDVRNSLSKVMNDNVSDSRVQQRRVEMLRQVTMDVQRQMEELERKRSQEPDLDSDPDEIQAFGEKKRNQDFVLLPKDNNAGPRISSRLSAKRTRGSVNNPLDLPVNEVDSQGLGVLFKALPKSKRAKTKKT
jgi:hypothetical protein